MKYNFKISLPLYKMLYSIAFMLLFALIRPTTTISEILVVIEPNVCLLAIIFFIVKLEKIELTYFTCFQNNISIRQSCSAF